jgi:sugar phosphate isomerase/epimerase
MVRIGLHSFSSHLPDTLGNPWYQLDADSMRLVKFTQPFLTPVAENKMTSLELLELPAEIASHGVNTLDLTAEHIPSIEPSYLAELRSALESSQVELLILDVNHGHVSSPDSAERSAGIKVTKRWMEIAAELGSAGVRYVPGPYASHAKENEPTPETIRLAGEAFRELANYAGQLGLKPYTENYKWINRAEDLLQVLDLSERDYGLVADFGNAEGPNKYRNLAKLLPRATAIHAWAEYEEDGTLKAEDFQHCLKMARDNGFDGPIMLLGGHPDELFKRTRDFWSGVDELRQQVQDVFGIGG